MLTIEIRYISGRVHATPWGSSHNEGRVEFPPSPWRLLRALISTWFERAPEIDGDVVRSLVAALSAHRPSYAVPRFAESHLRHYLPESAHKAGVDTSTAKVLDAFAAVERSTPLRVQWDVALATPERQALKVLAERIPYVGRAESLVEARLLDDHESIGLSTGEDFRTVQEGFGKQAERQMRLLCPAPPYEWGALLEVPWKARQKGYVFPLGSELLPFVSSGPMTWPRRPPTPRLEAKVTAIAWRMHGRGKIPITAAVAYCDVLRNAVLSRFKGKGDIPWELSGHIGIEPARSHHRHAHFLPVAEDGFLDGLVLWIPAGIDRNAADLVCSLSLSELRVGRSTEDERAGLRDFRPVRLYLQGRWSQGSESPDLASFDVARTWSTLTPYAPARYLRRDARMQRSLEAEVSRELTERGLPVPRAVSIVNSTDPSLARGASHPLDYRRHRAYGEFLRDGRTAFHLLLSFDEPVTGPIAIGALSHFGLGVFVPAGTRAFGHPFHTGPGR